MNNLKYLKQTKIVEELQTNLKITKERLNKVAYFILNLCNEQKRGKLKRIYKRLNIKALELTDKIKQEQFKKQIIKGFSEILIENLEIDNSLLLKIGCYKILVSSYKLEIAVDLKLEYKSVNKVMKDIESFLLSKSQLEMSF